MIRRNLRKIIPVYAIFPLLLTGLTDAFAYMGAKLIQSFVPFDYIDLTTVLDLKIPFQPVWVIIYILSYAFWAYQYLVVANESPKAACRLAAADAVAKIICFVFFVVLPSTNVRPEVEDSGIIPALMETIYALDTPTNLFPSMHCFIAWLGTRYMLQCQTLRHKTLTRSLCILGSLLVFASTLFTKQHVWVDVVGGIAVAEIGWLVARFTKLPVFIERLNESFMKTKLCKFL